ncbi:MAG: ribonuclease J [Sandaracinaceae bacterium]
MTPPLRFLPLGGLGEIGMNCLAVEHGSDRFIIDCGVTFDDRNLGVDVIHPDFTYLLEAPKRLRAIVLTHGHEDHIGAVPYLLGDIDVPVYGPAYALELLRERLAEGRPANAENGHRLRPIGPGDRIRIGEIEIEPYRVTHSIPDSTGLILRTPHGVVVHSGDFKIDPEPTDGQALDLPRLERLRDEEGVRLLLSDSTNAMVEGMSGGEGRVRERLEALVREAPGRVVVSIFASNVHRIRALAQVARNTGRRLCLLGRSLETHARIGEAQGHLDLGAVRVGRDEAGRIDAHELLVAATGTQGEAPAALARLAEDNHPDLSLSAGDRVVHSARVIPGNDRAVYAMLNAFERRGIEVVWKSVEPDVHVSGHAYRGEQRMLLEALRPSAFVPVHGTFLHMRHHAELARACGVAEVEVIENGDLLRLDDRGLHLEGRAPAGRVYRERRMPVPEVVLKDRALLAELGVAVVTVLVDADGRPTGDVDLLTRGVLHEDGSEDLLEEACDYVYQALDRKRGRADDEQLELDARRALKRFLARHVPRRPLCYAVVMRAPA